MSQAWIPRKRRGRPRTLKEIEALILRFATENPGWGYSRILAELKQLGILRLSRNTVKNILKAHGFDPLRACRPVHGQTLDHL